MNTENIVRTEPLTIVFCRQWTVSKEESAGAVLQPWIRMRDGTFKPFEAGFQMNRFGLEDLIGQLKTLLGLISGETAAPDRVLTRANTDAGIVEVISTLPSGQQYVMRVSPDFAKQLMRDLLVAAADIEYSKRQN